MAAYTHIVISSVTVYLFMIVSIRIFGKKELSQLSVVDLVFILLISNCVQNAMVGTDSSLTGGLVAATALFIVNYIFKYLFYLFPWLNKVVQGEAIMLIFKGKLIEKNMLRAKITLQEIHEIIREHGVPSIEEVNLAVLEVDGNVSVLSSDYNKRTVKKRKSHKVLSKLEE